MTSLTPHYYSDLHEFQGSINPYTTVSSVIAEASQSPSSLETTITSASQLIQSSSAVIESDSGIPSATVTSTDVSLASAATSLASDQSIGSLDSTATNGGSIKKSGLGVLGVISVTLVLSMVF